MDEDLFAFIIRTRWPIASAIVSTPGCALIVVGSLGSWDQKGKVGARGMREIINLWRSNNGFRLM